jgi:hypothetical protein
MQVEKTSTRAKWTAPLREEGNQALEKFFRLLSLYERLFNA